MTGPRVLAIGGLDPCGGAGVTADARVLHAHGCVPAVVTSCLTVQNRHGLSRVEPVAPDLLVAMVRAVFEDGPVEAVKIGLCGAAHVVDAVALALAGFAGPVVIDPVLATTAGGWAAPTDLIAAYRVLARAVPALWTPNAPELRALAPTGASAEWLRLGATGVVEKGGHTEAEEVFDVLVTATERTSFRHRRALCGEVHGTGCALASSIAAGLAHGREVGPAVRMGSRWVAACLHAMGGPQPRPRPFDPTAVAARVRPST